VDAGLRAGDHHPRRTIGRETAVSVRGAHHVVMVMMLVISDGNGEGHIMVVMVMVLGMGMVIVMLLVMVVVGVGNHDGSCGDCCLGEKDYLKEEPGWGWMPRTLM
jgi:hypothetical protein